MVYEGFRVYRAQGFRFLILVISFRCGWNGCWREGCSFSSGIEACSIVFLWRWFEV